MPAKTILNVACLLLLSPCFFEARAADEFDDFLQPLLVETCTKCHGEDEPEGEVDLSQFANREQFLHKPELIEAMIDALSAFDMPPEDEPEMSGEVRSKVLQSLKAMLRDATKGEKFDSFQIRRLNRFQYNNSVKDLFQLKRDLFQLTEKLMTRQENYLTTGKMRMPDTVRVACRSLVLEGGLSGVEPFPKDLRAAHGFDNQANQLTLSPLLLDSFLKLSVSVLNSPDFNADTVGIWDDFFQEPSPGDDLHSELQKRIEPFLRLAFRGAVEQATLDRYATYAAEKIGDGMPFADCMKKVASAALSSPLFLYRYRANDEQSNQFELASKLSFFLWGSGPDLELLRLAESGELANRETLNSTIDRMLADPKVERFLDAFPSQWMQLENVLAATPDFRVFNLNNSDPASLQMVLEPLLLFDAVFVEDRRIVDLIAPAFSYQSEFLETWYSTDLKPPPIDETRIAKINRTQEERRASLKEMIQNANRELKSILEPIKTELIAERKKADVKTEPVELHPYAAWEFNGDLKSSVNSLDLKAKGKIKFEDGMVVLNKAFLQSEDLPVELKAKTLEVWFQIDDVNQTGGGWMGIQGQGDFFDTIVLGERQRQHWISGSNGFSRTDDFPGSTPEVQTEETIQLVMVYQADGTTMLYRNGVPYGGSFKKNRAAFPKNEASVIFGLRHLPAGGNRFLNVRLDKARLYDRALTESEIVASHSGDNLFITDSELLQAMSSEQLENVSSLRKKLQQTRISLDAVPPQVDLGKMKNEAQRDFDNHIRQLIRSEKFERVEAADPRYGGVITNAAMLSMTSGPKRTHPIARGAWLIEVIFNDPPPPPPNDVPPLDEDAGSKHLTIREKFAQHRENPTCNGCHSRLDPLGFALENFDFTGRWRDKYSNGREVDSSGILLKQYQFDGVVRFKEFLVKEERRFAEAFASHLLRFALARELRPGDSLAVDSIANKTAGEGFRLRSLIKEVVLSDSFLQNASAE